MQWHYHTVTLVDRIYPFPVCPRTGDRSHPNPNGGFRPVPQQISKLRDYFVALSYGDRRLGYEAFDRRADRFAGNLVQLGIVSESTAQPVPSVRDLIDNMKR